MARNEVHINVGQLFVSVVTEHNYPDVIDDMAGRARNLTKEILSDMREVGIDIEDIVEGLSPLDFDEDDEEEEA